MTSDCMLLTASYARRLRIAAVASCAGLLSFPGFPQSAGETIYTAHCARCHDAPDTRAPDIEALRGMSVNRIIRAMDFGTMMSVTYMLDRSQRNAVAAYLGTAGEDRSAAGQAYCADRTVRIAANPRALWNGWSPLPTNTRMQLDAGMSIDDAAQLTLQWAFVFDGDVNAFAPPAVLDDQLFVGSAGGSVYALHAGSGCVQWQYQADGPVRTAMLVVPLADGYALVFGDQTGNLYALDAQSGELLWRDRPEPHESTKLTGAPIARQGVVYVPTASWEESRPLNPEYACCTFRGSVVAYGVADGTRLWQTFLVEETPEVIGRTAAGVDILAPSGVGSWSAPTLDAARGLLYVTTGNNYTGMTAHSDAVVALDLDTGAIVWSQQLIAGDEFNLYCRGLPDGCPGMDFDIGASAILERAADGTEILIAGQKSGWVYGLDPDAAGAVLWQTRVAEGGINGGVLWGMASDGDQVYAAASDVGRRAQPDRDAEDPRPNGVDPTRGGGLTALDIRTGERRWYAPPAACDPLQPVCSPAQPAAVTAIPGVVFSGAVDGHLRAFSSVDGRVIWDFDTAREYAGVNGVPGRGGSIDGDGPVVAGGWLYVTSGYGRNGGMPGNVLLAFAAPDSVGE